jgi:hypothetical protein
MSCASPISCSDATPFGVAGEVGHRPDGAFGAARELSHGLAFRRDRTETVCLELYPRSPAPVNRVPPRCAVAVKLLRGRPSLLGECRFAGKTLGRRRKRPMLSCLCACKRAPHGRTSVRRPLALIAAGVAVAVAAAVIVAGVSSGGPSPRPGHRQAASAGHPTVAVDQTSETQGTEGTPGGRDADSGDSPARGAAPAGSGRRPSCSSWATPTHGSAPARAGRTAGARQAPTAPCAGGRPWSGTRRVIKRRSPCCAR